MDDFSRIDNCNILLYDLPKMHISNLQHFHQETHLLMKTRRQDITAILKPLHWLSLHVKFGFKVLLLCFKRILDLGPFNLYDLF